MSTKVFDIRCILQTTIVLFVYGSSSPAISSDTLSTEVERQKKTETLRERFKNPPPQQVHGVVGPSLSNHSLISVHNNLKKTFALSVFIDHYKLCRLRGTESVEYLLSPGLHEVQVGTDFEASKPLVLRLRVCQIKRLECGVVSRGGLWKKKQIYLQNID